MRLIKYILIGLSFTILVGCGAMSFYPANHGYDSLLADQVRATMARDTQKPLPEAHTRP